MVALVVVVIVGIHHANFVHADATSIRVGLNATCVQGIECPRHTASSTPDKVSHIWIEPSSEPHMTALPSGEKEPSRDKPNNSKHV